jgi:hypothetical protein
MRTKSCPVRIKAAGTHEGTDEGVFEAIVAAYNLDSVGDRITPGAFAETLAEWKGRGDPIPVLWSHMSHDPDYHIGEVLEAEERPEGLWVKGRRVTQFSFAYDVEEGSWVEQKDGPGFYELRKLKLYEVGPTLIGANQATELLDVKSAAADMLPDLTKVQETLENLKAGRTLSSENEQRVRDIARLASELLDSLPSSNATSQDAEKATPAPPAAASPQEAPEAKAGQPAGPSPASLRLHADLAAFEAEVSTLTD